MIAYCNFITNTQLKNWKEVVLLSSYWTKITKRNAKDFMAHRCQHIEVKSNNNQLQIVSNNIKMIWLNSTSFEYKRGLWLECAVGNRRKVQNGDCNSKTNNSSGNFIHGGYYATCSKHIPKVLLSNIIKKLNAYIEIFQIYYEVLFMKICDIVWILPKSVTTIKRREQWQEIVFLYFVLNIRNMK